VQPFLDMGFLELGYRWDQRLVGFGLSFFWRDVENMILWRTEESCMWWVRSTNVEADLKGLELDCGFSHPYGVEGEISYSISKATDGRGQRLEYKPPNVFAWTVRARRDLSRHLAIGVTFSGKRVSSVTAGNQFDFSEQVCVENASLPDYASGLLYGYLQIDRAKVFCRVTNLFNDQIYPAWGRPQLPARSYEVGISWELWD